MSLFVSQRLQYLPWYFDCIFERSTAYRDFEKARSRFFCNSIDTIGTESKLNRMVDQLEKSDALTQKTFLHRLLLIKDRLSETQIREHIYTVVGAGYGSTATVSAHCILCLSFYPEMQELAYQEIMKVFPTEDSSITHNSLLELAYLDRIVKETLRLCPPIHAIARENMENFEIIPGTVMPKATVFVINIYALHHRKDLWGDDADHFNPDRFIPENFEGRQQYYIPFATGKRNCIGYRYALTSFKIILLKLLRNFKFSTTLRPEEIRFSREIDLKLIGEHLVSVEKRRLP